MFEAPDLDQIYRVAVVRPVEPSATAIYGKSPSSTAGLEALRQNLRKHLAGTKKRVGEVLKFAHQADQDSRAFEMEVRQGGLVVSSNLDRTNLGKTIAAFERVMPVALGVVDEQSRRVQEYAKAPGPIGKAIYREEQRVLKYLTKLYDTHVTHYYFLLSVRARDERANAELVATSPADIDRLFA